MNAKSLTAIAVVVIAGSLVLLQAIAAPPTGTKKAEVGAPAPGFSLPDTYGKTFTLSEFKGKTVVLEWVNQKCPVSRGKHDDKTMQTTYAKYAAKGVVWLGIDSSHYLKAESNRVYAAEKHLNYPILNDPDGKVGRAINLDGDSDIEPQDSGSANNEPTFEFRYNESLAGYIYNLNVDGLLAGVHHLHFVVSTPGNAELRAEFALK